MENTTKRIRMAPGSTYWEKAGMTEDAWKKAVKFDSTDWGWVIMSIGMAIGSGIVFLPVQVGLVGLWVFLASAVISCYRYTGGRYDSLLESGKCRSFS